MEGAGEVQRRWHGRGSGVVQFLFVVVTLAATAQAIELPVQLRRLNFCQHSSWAVACKYASSTQRRSDIYCARRLEPMRKAIISYCERHKAALADIAANGKQAARKYKFVAASYEHWWGLGNRLPGVVSAFFVALMTGELWAACGLGTFQKRVCTQ
jgi:hypothetical protein